MNFSSKLLENAVNEMSQLPGIGKRTALRLVLFLLQQPKTQTKDLSNSLNQAEEEKDLLKMKSEFFVHLQKFQRMI